MSLLSPIIQLVDSEKTSETHRKYIKNCKIQVMTNRVRLYKIRVPFTISEWRKGQRYILTKLTTSDVQIVYHKTRKEDKTLITETHKILDVKNKIPYIIKKVIPDDACIVDEFSTNVEALSIDISTEKGKQVYNIETHIENKDGILAKLDVNRTEIVDKTKENNEDYKVNIKNVNFTENDNSSIESLHSCTTSYKNRHFDEKTFILHIKTKISNKDIENIFGMETAPKEEAIDFRSFNKKDIKKVGERDYSGEWSERLPSIYVYKLIDVSINSFGFGWITKDIDKHVRNMLVDVQQQIIETYDEWKNLSEEELVKLEKEMIQKFIVKIE